MLSGTHTGWLYDALGMHVYEKQELENGQVIVMSHQSLEPRAIDQVWTLQITLLSMPRIIALFHQHSLVAHDEMNFYLQAVASSTKCEWVHPMIFGDMETHAFAVEGWMTSLEKTASCFGQAVTVVLLQHHWIPFVCMHDEKGFTIVTTNEGVHLWDTIKIHGPDVLTTDQVRVKIVPCQVVFDYDCGFQCIWWLFSQATASTQVFAASMALAQEMRFNFAMSLMGARSKVGHPCELMLGGGGSSEMSVALAAILKEHGVPVEQLQSRIQQVLEELSSSVVEQAFQSKRPWQSLKAAANAKKLQLVLPHELQQVLESRAKSGQPIGNRRQKALKRGPHAVQMPVSIQSNDVIVPEGVFRQEDGIALPQIRISELAPNARGIVVGSEAELQAFMHKAPFSSEGLALIVLEPPPSIVEQVGTIRFPICCVSTQEPMLITAAMIQKGTKKVERNLPVSRAQVAERSNVVYKCMLFQDEVPDWAQVTKSPVKCVLEGLPMLQTCRESECQCPRRHPKPDEEFYDAILDIWNRDFLTHKFSKTAPGQADLFACTIRIDAHFARSMSKASGHGGLYIEPRAIDGKRASDAYHTIWLPRKTVCEVRAEQAVIKVPTYVVRVQHKFGLCVALAQAEDVHQTLRGNVPFLAGSDRQQWTVGPLPWGTTRQSLQELLQIWQWRGKPLQPAGRAADGTGLLWVIQSLEPPPNTVYSLAHGDVVLTRTDVKKELPNVPTSLVEASKRTRQQLAKSPEPEDLLQTNEPWAKYEGRSNQPPSRGPPPMLAVTHAHLQTLEARMEAKLLAKSEKSTSDESMGVEWENRVAALEQQVSQLAAHQQHQTSQSAAIANQVNQLTQKLDQQSQTLESKIGDTLAEHMQRIEGLLSKRARGE